MPFELLKEGKWSVAEVAYRTGFSSPSYFSNCFHQQYDFAPVEIHRQKTVKIDPDNFLDYKTITKSDHADKGWFGIGKRYIFGVVVALIAMFLTFYYHSKNAEKRTQDAEVSIAVLPFQNFSENNEYQYLSDGMMEAILSHISKIGGLRVISRTSMEQYRETSKPIGEIGSELGVGHILEESTYREGNHVRVTVQLINVRTDRHLWAESFDSELDNIFDVQSQIAKKIANQLELTINPDEKKHMERVPTSNPKAYDLYQQAQYYYIHFSQERHEPDYQKSKSLFRSAILEDTTFADAYTKLADLYWTRNYRTEYYSDTFMDTVRVLCQHALSIDPRSSEAHRLLGQYYFETGYRAGAIAELETSIGINRNNAVSYASLGFYYNWIGRWEEGIPHMYQSIRLDPYSIFVPLRYAYLARGYLDLLDFDRTLFYAQRAIERGAGSRPVTAFASWIIAHTHLIQGNSEEALRAADQLGEIDEISALRIKGEVYCHLLEDCDTGMAIYSDLAKRQPGRFNFKNRYAYALWEFGKVDSSKIMFDAQIEECEKELELGRIQRNDPYYNLAGIYAFLGDEDKAFKHLDKHRFTSGLEIYAERDPLFRDLWDQREFKTILKKARDEKKILRRKIDELVNQ